MVVNCKHVAAVLMAARERTAMASTEVGSAEDAAGPSWERATADVVRASVASRDDARTPLALQFEVATPLQPRPSVYGRVATNPVAPNTPRIRLRPATRGRSGAWVHRRDLARSAV